MRFKMIIALAVIAAVAVGVTASNAALRSETSLKIKLAKAKAPASVVMKVDNSNFNTPGNPYGGGIVPERINEVVITSKSAKWSGKGAVQCKIPIPSAAAGNNTGAIANPGCPAKSKVGTGDFIATAGTPGQPYDTGDAGVITGTLTIYNYKPSGGAQAALLLEAKSKNPVPNVYQYILATVKGGVLKASIPNMADLPVSLSNLFKVGDTYKTLSMATMNTKINSPKSKTPLLTLNNFKSMDFSVVLNRQ